MGVFSMVFGSRSIVGARREIGAIFWEQSEEYMLSSNANRRAPFVVILVELYPLISALVVLALSMIAALSRVVNYSQVLVCVVECLIALYVISLARVAIFEAKDVSMHGYLPARDSLSYAAIACCVEGAIGFGPYCIPLPLHQVLVAMRRNSRNLTLRKLDFTISLFKRHPQTPLSRVSGLLQQPMPLLYPGGA